MSTTITNIASASSGQDYVIVGFNPEMADLDNPDGTGWELAHLVEAVTDRGRRFIHQHRFEDAGAAERLAERVHKAGVINLEHWNETYEVYGSPAWQDADAERELAHQMSEHRGTVRGF